MTSLTPKRGQCRYCRCTEDNACVLAPGPVPAEIANLVNQTYSGRASTMEAITCSWTDKGRTVCSNPECQKKHARRLA
jgi:hypothetical protein